MSVRIASKCAPNTDVYYVQSQSKPELEYTVIHLHSRHVNKWLCNCPHFYYRQITKAVTKAKQVRHCKHIIECRVLVEMGHKVA